MTLAQKNLVIHTILDELEISPPLIVRDRPVVKGSRYLTVGGKLFKVVGKKE